MRKFCFVLMVIISFVSGSCAAMRGDGKGATFGALAFGIIGGLSGFFVQKSLQKRDGKIKNKTLFHAEKYPAQGKKPCVSNSKKECVR